MLRKTFAFAVLGLVLAIAVGSASAATVTYTLKLDANEPDNGCVGCTLNGAGTWDLYASVDSGDNFGIASYKAALLNTTSILHRSPRTNLSTDPAGEDPEPAPAGFTLLRSGTGINPIVASQDTVGPTPFIIKGFGQTANSFVGAYPGTTTSGTSAQQTAAGWEASVLIAEGAYLGALPAFNLADPSAANVFTGANGVATIAANIVTMVMPVVTGDTIDPVITPLVRNFELGVTDPATLANLQLTATDNVTPAGSLVWSNLTYAGGPGKNAPGSDDADLTGGGLFTWNPNGWKQGAHTFNATVADAAGNDVNGLSLTVNLTVPEPATLSLFGLALVGFVGFARRRR